MKALEENKLHSNYLFDLVLKQLTDKVNVLHWCPATQSCFLLSFFPCQCKMIGHQTYRLSIVLIFVCPYLLINSATKHLFYDHMDQIN